MLVQSLQTDSSYASTTFRKLLSARNVTQSPSNSGCPHDNAVAESFFALFKRKELYRRNYQSVRDFYTSVDKYMTFYNTERPHKANQNKSPIQFETEKVPQEHLDMIGSN